MTELEKLREDFRLTQEWCKALENRVKVLEQIIIQLQSIFAIFND